jgi:glycosyltransferase involved in cell wall biosynthesis
MPGPTLLDATPLVGGHSVRGIGTALRGLLHGMVSLPPEERPEVAIRVTQPPPPEFTARRIPWPNWPLHRVPDPWPSLVSERAVRRLEPALFHAVQPALMPEDVPTVATCYDLVPGIYARDYLSGPGRAAEARAYSRYLERLRDARLVMAPSKETAADLAEFARLDRGRIRVVPLAAPIPIPAAGEVPPGDYVLFSGSLEPHKNARLVIAAMAHAPASVRLVLTGPWSSRRVARLRRFTEAVDAGHRVVWLGYVPAERLAALRANALALVVPSWKEGFGLPVLEGMQAGVPIIASDTRALREAGGEAALYLPLGDAKVWGRAIGDLAADRARRRLMGEDGRAQAALFSWEETARRVRDVYLEAAGG